MLVTKLIKGRQLCRLMANAKSISGRYPPMTMTQGRLFSTQNDGGSKDSKSGEKIDFGFEEVDYNEK